MPKKSSAAKPACKDCRSEGVTRVRSTPYAGPRCATHHLAFKRKTALRRHENHVMKTYDLKAGQYDELYESQGGVCYICGPTTGHSGKTRRLIVDHDHKTGEVRGLLCQICNDILGRWRDDPECFVRGLAYLTNPPSRLVLDTTPVEVEDVGLFQIMSPVHTDYVRITNEDLTESVSPLHERVSFSVAERIAQNRAK